MEYCPEEGLEGRALLWSGWAKWSGRTVHRGRERGPAKCLSFAVQSLVVDGVSWNG